jgi:hypothetical protein
MNLFIPACGDRLVLTAPWAFQLYLEHRNVKFAVSKGLLPEKEKNSYGVWEGEKYRSGYKRVDVVLKEGSVLECDRVYIRTFNKSALRTENDFDSITWKLMKGGKPVRNGRFWAKLPDCYSIEYRLDPDSLYRDRVKLVKSIMTR